MSMVPGLPMRSVIGGIASLIIMSSSRWDSHIHSLPAEKEVMYSVSNKENAISLLFRSPAYRSPYNQKQVTLSLFASQASAGPVKVTVSYRTNWILCSQCDTGCMSAFEATKQTLDFVPVKNQWLRTVEIANIGNRTYHQPNRWSNSYAVWCFCKRIVNAWKGGLNGWDFHRSSNGFRVTHYKVSSTLSMYSICDRCKVRAGRLRAIR